MVAAKHRFILQRSTRGWALPLPHPFPNLLSFFGNSWVSFSRWFVIHSLHAYCEVSFVPGLAGAPMSLEGRTFWDCPLPVWHQRRPSSSEALPATPNHYFTGEDINTSVFVKIVPVLRSIHWVRIVSIALNPFKSFIRFQYLGRWDIPNIFIFILLLLKYFHWAHTFYVFTIQ